MTSDDDDMLHDSERVSIEDVLSRFPDAPIEEILGLEAQTMQNNNEGKTLTNATADVTQRMLARRVHDGKSVDMSVAAEIIRGVILGYRGVTSMTGFEVAYQLPKVVDELIVLELSRLVRAPKGSRLTWKAAADLVGISDSSLHYKYGNRVYDLKA